MAVVTPLNNPGGPEGDTVTMAEQLLNTEYFMLETEHRLDIKGEKGFFGNPD